MSPTNTPDASSILVQAKLMANGSSPTLDNIAVEIFLRVTEFLETAKDLAALARTCRRFRTLIDQDGWRIFVQTRFPSIMWAVRDDVDNSHIPNDWKDLARGLTAQSRAWDKRALSACLLDAWDSTAVRLHNASRSQVTSASIEPAGLTNEHSNQLCRWDRLSGSSRPFHLNESDGADAERPAPRTSFRRQTTPYHPVIDTKVEFSGKLSSKKEIVAWSTGAEVFVCVRRSGSLLPEFNNHDRDHFDEYHNMINWFTVQHEDFQPGIGDVTSINVVEPSTDVRPYSPDTLTVDFIVGRASGHLHRYSVSNTEPVQLVVNTFNSLQKQDASSRPAIRSTDVSRNQLLAACSDRILSLYKSADESHDVWPVCEVKIKLDRPNAQAWSARFTSNEKLILGLGQSLKPLHAYHVTPTDLTLTGTLGIINEETPTTGIVRKSSDNVYAVEPVSANSSAGGNSNGQVFLSGWYDGVCRYS